MLTDEELMAIEARADYLSRFAYGKVMEAILDIRSLLAEVKRLRISLSARRPWHSPDTLSANEMLRARAGVEAIVEDVFRHRTWALVSWIESEWQWKVWHHRPEDAPSPDLKVIAWREFERIEDQVLP